MSGLAMLFYFKRSVLKVMYLRGFASSKIRVYKNNLSVKFA